jgi:hypothetical protein
MGATDLQDFNEVRFGHQIDRALKHIKRILDNTRHPRYAADVDHKYDDKFGIVGTQDSLYSRNSSEFLTNITLGAHMNCLSLLGVKDLSDLRLWAERRSVTLRFVVEERYTSS